MSDQAVDPFLDFHSRQNKRPADVARDFTEGAPYYDAAYSSMEYSGHITLAERVASFFPDKSSIRILDVAAGTGLVAQELWKQGFRSIDGLDPSDGMRDMARKRNIYSNYFLEFMDGHRIDTIKTDTYDCITVSMGFNIGLIPCLALTEMIRIVRPGGLICFNFLPVRFTTVDEYRHRLEPLMTWMEQDGVWAQLDIKNCEIYSGSGPSIIYRYIVKTSDVDAENYKRKLANN